MKFATQKLVTMLALSACVGVGLGACAPIMVGGAVMSSLVATDRRTAGTQIEDEGIELRAASGVRANLGDRVRVNVTSYNRQVLLTGEAPNAQDKQLVEQVVSRVENVRSVVNELSIQDSPSFTQRSSDGLVTGMVKANMVDAKDLFANSFKVTTERGTTYLMGRVTQREANRATDIARGTKGVQKVVRVLEIISEEELQGMQPKPAAAEAK
ncbi:MAG: BON domain-containing protein [Rhodoferax sp.]|uniref:BON domain-containing protein n=1 Tax=Rhodoferax sp. TaxID=50421 RepID=UPI00271D91E9|nr:BON domain-containing protein [Rhodoferax sp.]MDO8449627.1 BON domain-containing protein [Rhodoferax sp.]